MFINFFRSIIVNDNSLYPNNMENFNYIYTNKTEYMFDEILSLRNVNMQNNLVRYVHSGILDSLQNRFFNKLCLSIKSALKVFYI